MSFLKGLFGGARPPVKSEDCVKVHFKLSDGEYGSEQERDAVHGFTDKLDALIREHDAGEFDGDEFGGGEGTLFMYGPDADRLYETVLPALKSWAKLRGGYVIKRYAETDRSVRINF
jgi:hypothetical protein